jgi:hypothetical protein
VRWHRLIAVPSAVAAAGAIVACGSSAGGRGAVTSAPQPARAAVAKQSASRLAEWRPFMHVDRPLDLAGPRSDGSVVLAAAGRLWLLSRAGTIAPFMAGYRSPGGEEPYIAVAPSALARAACPFRGDVVYALRLQSGRGVVAISGPGRVRLLARIDAPGLIDGIAFDATGAFGHRLLVTINAGARTTVDAIDCRGVVSVITRSAPRVEGGIAVAPATFGRFGGDLIAPDETGGRIFAITPGGESFLVADSGLPHGGDIGVESEAFVPPGAPRDALLADRLTPGNRHPGDNVVLRLPALALAAVGVRAGDLLVATEGGARTDAVRCGAAACHVMHVADGPAIAHAEGHIVFASAD